jgi:hypothetical protein
MDMTKRNHKPLYKTTVVIWSEFDGTTIELSELARDAEVGESYCAFSRSELVEDPESDPFWDGTDFFDDGEEQS